MQAIPATTEQCIFMLWCSILCLAALPTSMHHLTFFAVGCPLPCRFYFLNSFNCWLLCPYRCPSHSCPCCSPPLPSPPPPLLCLPVSLWDLGQQRCVHSFSLHADSVWSLAADRDFSRFVSGGRDGCVSHPENWCLGCVTKKFFICTPNPPSSFSASQCPPPSLSPHPTPSGVRHSSLLSQQQPDCE